MPVLTAVCFSCPYSDFEWNELDDLDLADISEIRAELRLITEATAAQNPTLAALLTSFFDILPPADIPSRSRIDEAARVVPPRTDRAARHAATFCDWDEEVSKCHS